MKKMVKGLADNLFNVEIFRTDKKNIHILDKNNIDNAWFSYSMQLKNFITERKIDLIIDVGANRGQFAKEMTAITNVEIFSFEPVTKMYEDLERLSKEFSQIRPQKFAVGEINESREINVYAHDTLSSFHDKSDLGQELFSDGENGKIEKEVVNIVRLDDFLIENVPNIMERNILLKTDTQGFDLSVVRGAEKINSRVFGIQSELSIRPLYKEMPHWTESIELYESLGFSLGGFWPILKQDFQYIEADCLFVKPLDKNSKMTKFHVI